MSLEAMDVENSECVIMIDEEAEDPLRMDSGSEGADEFKFEVAVEPECVLVPVEIESIHDKSRPFLLPLCDHDAADTTNSEEELQETYTDSPQNAENVCDNCGRAYAHKRSLIRHMVICLPGTTPNPNIVTQSTTRAKKFTCEICQQTCDDFEHLKSHIRSHTGDKPFTCEICSKEFALLYYLKKHKRIHAGEISCEVCNKAFATPSHLKRHQSTQRCAKTFSCKLCDEKFATISSFNIHQRTHTGEKIFSCKSCPKKFTSSSNLRIHGYIHTGEKPHKCEFCSKRFTQVSTLNNHRRVHTGEKPYSCEYCLKKFAFLGNYKAHKLIHL
ncbi:putative zinc finger protein 833 isoform X3 [Cydia pomonella]|uniref:putative zinc finger protein 833 isoform X3 n=1 Tax=Cydia pomonella TaxID=82600 RepID=UPI002ADDA7A2|nr:putative zinc finger protein 833 isoform X3 [Cydia pomonella]